MRNSYCLRTSITVSCVDVQGTLVMEVPPTGSLFAGASLDHEQDE